MYAACTIIARNYLAQARVLAESFSQLHPQIEFVTLIVDGIEADRAEVGVGAVILPSELGIHEAMLHSMMMIYDVMEFATALKPGLLSALIRQGHTAVAYFDPDIRVYADLVDIFDTASERGVLLTPHALFPIPRDGRNLTEKTIMQAGIYNLGFVAVGARAYSFLIWWHERLTIDAIVDVENALFTDQRWIDWVPALFPHLISRDQGLNAAYWNLHERPITQVAGIWYAGKSPLRFYHFSGYDPSFPWLLSKHMGAAPRTLLSQSTELRRLVGDYSSDLVSYGHTEMRKTPYRLNELPNGMKIPSRLRRFFRAVLLKQIAIDATPPDPFGDTDAFVMWLCTPAFGAQSARLTPAEYSIWFERADLRGRFGDPNSSDGEAFHDWLAGDQVSVDWLEYVASFAVVEGDESVKLPTPLVQAKSKAFGWSVVAYANSELGVGEAGRRIASLIGSAGVPMELVGTDTGSLSRQNHVPRLQVRNQIGYENAVFCVNADQLPSVGRKLGIERLRGRRTSLWFWELSEFPREYARAAELVHEVWVTSAFTQHAIQAVVDKPVRLVRLPIEVPLARTRFSRRSLGIPEGKFVFLTNFDYLSVYERKNPIGAILSYLAAFGPGDGAVLIVKSINASIKPLDAEHVRSFALGRPDVLFIDEYVTSAAMKAMIELADCYVSLHRSEGYGLNLADAMAHHTATIATAYSGNLEFMTSDTSHLIPYSMVEVGTSGAPYDRHSEWADPDLDAASFAMREVFDDESAGHAMASRAFAHVTREHSMGKANTQLAAFLNSSPIEPLEIR